METYSAHAQAVKAHLEAHECEATICKWTNPEDEIVRDVVITVGPFDELCEALRIYGLKLRRVAEGTGAWVEGKADAIRGVTAILSHNDTYLAHVWLTTGEDT